MTRADRKRRRQAKARKARIEAQSRLRQGTGASTLAGLKVAWRGIAWGWKALGVTLVVLGAVSQIYFFIWRVSVTPGEALGKTDEPSPRAQMFILKNEGQFAVNDVAFHCRVSQVHEGNLIIRDNIVDFSEFNVPYLDVGAETATPCYMPATIHPKLISLDVTVSVSYRPSFFPFRREKSFRFLGSPKGGNDVSWFPFSKEDAK